MAPLSLKHLRLAYITASYLTFVFVMIRTMVAQREFPSDPLFATALAVFITMACVADSALMGRPIVFEARFPFAVTWAIALPVYLIRSRGWRGVVILLAIFGVLLGTAIGCAVFSLAVGIALR